MTNYVDNFKRLGLSYRQQLVGRQGNVPGTRRQATDGGAWHDTGNRRRGANAAMHANFVRDGGGPNQVSFTFCVDDDEVVQILPLDWVNIAQGAGWGNERWFSVEQCINQDGDEAKARDNTAKVFAAVFDHYELPPTAVRQHNYFSGKNCPYRIRDIPGEWDRQLQAIKNYQQELGRTVSLPLPAPRQPVILNGHEVGGVYLHWFDRLGGISVVGLPISDVENMVFEGIGLRRVQWFERARIEVDPTNNNVTFGRVGAEAKAAWR